MMRFLRNLNKAQWIALVLGLVVNLVLVWLVLTLTGCSFDPLGIPDDAPDAEAPGVAGSPVPAPLPYVACSADAGAPLDLTAPQSVDMACPGGQEWWPDLGYCRCPAGADWWEWDGGAVCRRVGVVCCGDIIDSGADL